MKGNMRNFPNLFLIVTSTFLCVSSRAVNISNTWVLPEEGFPVFYRYFRDRISWYEADAVCQFHHASLVTVDSTSQHDAVRAYLKELDINNNVWVSLSRAEDSTPLARRDLRKLSNDGHWEETIPVGSGALCAAVDPTTDFRWHPLLCGGPEVASFICQLPVPSWATGANGCLLTELPSLTILYIPEQSSLELTSDCGLDGMKQVTCRGHTDKEELIRKLTCNDYLEENRTTKTILQGNTVNLEVTSSPRTTKPWIWNTIDLDYGPTRQRRETDDTLAPIFATKSGIEKRTLETVKTDTTTPAMAIGKSVTSTEINVQEQELKSSQEEYPSVISQGQLFSIIENGTMFDIIELNNNNNVSEDYTTVIYHKEPTEVPKLNDDRPKEEAQVTPTLIEAKSSVGEKKLARKSENDLLDDVDNNIRDWNKEFEMAAIAPNSLIKLNRTNRKDLKDYQEEHKVVEIMLQKDPFKKFVVTTKIANKEKRTDKHFANEGETMEPYNKTVEIKIIDPRIDDLNVVNATDDESETIPPPIRSTNENTFTTAKLEDIDDNIDLTTTVKPTAKPKSQQPTHPNLQKSELKPNVENNNSTQETLEPIPQQQPRPNRQRMLTKPQRRSFYPYFFSRVLG